ncbi:MAG: hypothetical protein FWE88_02665 [Phycisphaerae bacterium]|nr:hypothetical protein [Phycisphaerae bacterium]
MEILGAFTVLLLIESILTWILLLIVVPIAHRFADFSLLPWSELLWKLGVTALAVNAAMLPITLYLHWMLSWPIGLIVLWIFLAKWLDVDGFGLKVIIGVTIIVRTFIIGYLMVAINVLR